ncbi:Wzz/FepE/Etk N-terminal domain-containing protein, partial [Daejeonella sp.]|uniref:Wzz/FepE/Etk N-terminal domain-containing protein n=1 Tax=Daejeonella sp. TaxID=2805397 RepID=UPI0037BFBE43
MNSNTTQDYASQNSVGNSDSDEISLSELILKIQEWWAYLMRQWKLIISMAFIGSLLGLGYAFIEKPIYKAEFSFVLEDEKSAGGLGGALGLASQFGLDLGGGGGGGIFAGDNLLELMKSRSMVQKALLSPISVNGKSQSLADYYISFREMRDDWEDKSQLTNLGYSILADPSRFNRAQDSILMEIHKEIIKDFLTVAKIDKKLSILKVTVKTENESFSKAFTEALVSEVSQFYIETKTKKSAKNVAILQHQTDSVRNQLNRAISGVAQSNDNILNLNASRQVLRTSGQQRQIDVQANTAILTELVKNLEL